MVTGKGVQTEIYIDDANKEIVVVVIETFIGKVYAVSKRNDWFQLNDENGDIFNNLPYGFKVGDMILYWTCGNNGHHFENKAWNNSQLQLHHAEVVKPVQVYVADTYRSSKGIAYSTFTNAEGKVYEYAANIADSYDGLTADVGAASTKKTLNVWTDKFGYVMYWNNYSATTELKAAYFVENTAKEVLGDESSFIDGNWKFDFNYFIDTVDFDGKSNAKVDVDESLVLALADNWTPNMAGLLAYYSVKANGDAKLELAGTIVPDGWLDASTGKIMTGETPTLVVGNDNTKYMVRTFNYGTGAYEYKTFTGYKNVDKDYLGTINVGTAGTPINTLQYLDRDENRIAEYVFIDAAYAHASDVFFLLDLDGSGSCDKLIPSNIKAQYPAYDIYNVVINGEVAKMLIADPKNTTYTSDLYTANIVALGVDVHGQKLYASFEVLKTATSDLVEFGEIDGGMIRVKSSDAVNFTWERVSDDVVVLLRFTAEGGHDFNGDDKFESYAVVKGAEAFNASRYSYLEYANLQAWVMTDAAGVITHIIMDVE